MFTILHYILLNLNSSGPGRISGKIRENINDDNFNNNFIKAKEELKQTKGLELRQQMKPAKSYISSIPQTLYWNDVHLEEFVKNRYENSTEQKTHIKG